MASTLRPATLRPTTIRATPVALTLPDLDRAGIAPATAEAIANYNAIVTRLADADAALEAAHAGVRIVKDAFLNASAVAVRFRAEPPDREAIADAEQRVRDARQYREVVRRALDDAGADLLAAVRAERALALDVLDLKLTEARKVEAEAIEEVARLRAQRAELHAIRRWMSAFPGAGDHVMQYRAGTAGTLPELRGPDGEQHAAATVLDALRADAAR
jgi:hypothetical protein